MNKFRAIIFDIDGTLTSQNSWQAFTRDIGGSVAMHLAIYEDHVNGKIGLDESKQKLLKMWKETGKAKKDHIEQIYNTWPIKPGAYTLVNWLKKKGYLVCLITGSVGLYAKHVADKLGVNNYYSNAELYFDEEGNLIDFHYTADQADVKLKQFKEFCELNNLKEKECVPVGDSNNDIELFRHTENGILVDGIDVADELRQAAWKIISSLEEVIGLLESV